MKVYNNLLTIQKEKNTRLCVGIDPRKELLPKAFRKNLKELLKYFELIIQITNPFVCAYKINFAFFEQFGYKGYKAIESLKNIIPADAIKIADAKRADIGITSKAYAKSIYEYFNFDATTLNPYLGIDSLLPFFEYQNRINFVLICTSNPGSSDFQKLKVKNKFLFEIVEEKFLANFDSDILGFVVGATNPEEFKIIRQKAPKNFILTPGIGAQGGDLKSILNSNNNCPLVVNVSRDIIFPTQEKNFENQILEKTKYYWELLKIEK